MVLNKVLAIVIVLIMLLGFIVWFIISAMAFSASPTKAMMIIIPGLINFGFWFIVAWRLYYSTYSRI